MINPIQDIVYCLMEAFITVGISVAGFWYLLWIVVSVFLDSDFDYNMYLFV